MNLEDADLADFGELVKPQPETGLLAVEARRALGFLEGITVIPIKLGFPIHYS